MVRKALVQEVWADDQRRKASSGLFQRRDLVCDGGGELRAIRVRIAIAVRGVDETEELL